MPADLGVGFSILNKWVAQHKENRILKEERGREADGTSNSKKGDGLHRPGLLRFRESKAVKDNFIYAEKTNHLITLLCKVFNVSESGFHAWQRRSI